MPLAFVRDTHYASNVALFIGTTLDVVLKTIPRSVACSLDVVPIWLNATKVGTESMSMSKII
jgi:hypothetical protein